jgi:hypothetical protein
VTTKIAVVKLTRKGYKFRMGLFVLTPVSQSCSSGAQSSSSMNPIMTYDSGLGTPNTQKIVPPFPNLTAHIDEVNGIASAYTWNVIQQKWL